jgi:Bacterial Ig-like domain (group 2)
VKVPTGLLVAAALLGCSGLDESEAGVVGIEVSYPGPDTLEVGQSIQLSARPLNKDGDSVGTAVTWVSVDPTATIDAATGVLTGVSAGGARIQATVGALGSQLITFAVIDPADTLVLTSDSIVTLAAGAVASGPLTAGLDHFTPAGLVPLASRGVIYALTSPDPAAGTPTVLLQGNVVSDTLPTGSDGNASTTLVVVTGSIPPDSAIVTVRAERTGGATVPGSGQRFIIRFTAP